MGVEMNRIFILLYLVMFACVSVWNVHKFYLKIDDNDRRYCEPNKIPFVITKDVPDHLADNIQESFEYWDDLTERDLFIYMGVIDIEYGPAFEKAGIIVIDLHENEVLYDHELTKENDNILALSYLRSHPNGCIASSAIFIYSSSMNTTESSFKSIIRHEIGHVLGLGHNTDMNGLMYPTLEKYRTKVKEISEYELKAFKLYYE